MGIPWEFVRDFTKLMYEVSPPSLSLVCHFARFGSFAIQDIYVR